MEPPGARSGERKGLPGRTPNRPPDGTNTPATPAGKAEIRNPAPSRRTGRMPDRTNGLPDAALAWTDVDPEGAAQVASATTE